MHQLWGPRNCDPDKLRSRIHEIKYKYDNVRSYTTHKMTTALKPNTKKNIVIPEKKLKLWCDDNS